MIRSSTWTRGVLGSGESARFPVDDSSAGVGAALNAFCRVGTAARHCLNATAVGNSAHPTNNNSHDSTQQRCGESHHERPFVLEPFLSGARISRIAALARGRALVFRLLRPARLPRHRRRPCRNRGRGAGPTLGPGLAARRPLAGGVDERSPAAAARRNWRWWKWRISPRWRRRLQRHAGGPRRAAPTSATSASTCSTARRLRPPRSFS